MEVRVERGMEKKERRGRGEEGKNVGYGAGEDCKIFFSKRSIHWYSVHLCSWTLALHCMSLSRDRIGVSSSGEQNAICIHIHAIPCVKSEDDPTVPFVTGFILADTSPAASTHD